MRGKKRVLLLVCIASRTVCRTSARIHSAAWHARGYASLPKSAHTSKATCGQSQNRRIRIDTHSSRTVVYTILILILYYIICITNYNDVYVLIKYHWFCCEWPIVGMGTCAGERPVLRTSKPGDIWSFMDLHGLKVFHKNQKNKRWSFCLCLYTVVITVVYITSLSTFAPWALLFPASFSESFRNLSISRWTTASSWKAAARLRKVTVAVLGITHPYPVAILLMRSFGQTGSWTSATRPWPVVQEAI